MNNKFTRIFWTGCICAMLLTANAFATPFVEEGTYREPADSTLEVNIDDSMLDVATDENAEVYESADFSEDSLEGADEIELDDTIPDMEDVEIGNNDPVDGPIYAPVEIVDIMTRASDLKVVALKDSKLYASAGTASGVVGTMTKGTVRTVLSTSGNFYKVKIDGTNAWVHQKNVADTSTVTIKVTAKSDCNVYSEASTTSEVVTTIPKGTTRTVLNYSGNFYKIKMNGITGWVKMSTDSFTIDIEVDETTVYDKIAALAKTKVGCSYVYGATGPNSFDCSGLVYYCYTNCGITGIPRVASDQYNSCTKVSKSALQPGYLVFFNCSGSGVDHVGIYLGNNQFVHAANPSDGVMINSLAENYYSTRYVGGGYLK